MKGKIPISSIEYCSVPIGREKRKRIPTVDSTKTKKRKIEAQPHSHSHIEIRTSTALILTT